MLQKQMMRSFRISWRSFDVKTNKPLIDILEPSKNIYNSWLSQTFCTIGQNQTLEKSVSVNTTQFKDEQKTDEILEKIFVEGSRELSKGRKKGDSDFIDWNNSMQLIKRSEEVLPDIKPTPEELENIRATKPVASLASLVNESPTLQKLIDLGVGLWSWEKQGQLGLAVKLDFQQDVVPLIQFLTDLGVPSDHLGLTLTRSAELLEQSIQDLTTRVDYLKSKKLTSEDILNIVAKTPKWLTFSVKGIDGRLGFLQKTFQLSGWNTTQVAIKISRSFIQTWFQNKMFARIAQNASRLTPSLTRSFSAGNSPVWKLGKLNHVAIAVPDLEAATAMYRDILGATVSAPQALPEHGVTTVFVNLDNTKLELLHPLGDRSPIAGFLIKNKSGGIHHICIEVNDIEAAVKELKAKNIRCLTENTRIGAHGKPVMFLHPKDCNGVLVELEQE